MRKEITVSAEKRESRGKNEARRLRVQGLAPGVVYGADLASVAVSVNPKEVNKILHSSTGHNTIFNLAIQGVEETPAMIVDWQNGSGARPAAARRSEAHRSDQAHRSEGSRADGGRCGRREAARWIARGHHS